MPHDRHAVVPFVDDDREEETEFMGSVFRKTAVREVPAGATLATQPDGTVTARRRRRGHAKGTTATVHTRADGRPSGSDRVGTASGLADVGRVGPRAGDAGVRQHARRDLTGGYRGHFCRKCRYCRRG